MNGAFDRQRAEEILERYDRIIRLDTEAGLDPIESEQRRLDRLAECFVPDRRIAAISALCKQGEAYGYVRIDAIRDVLNGGS
jgi:hypothetical protein